MKEGYASLKIAAIHFENDGNDICGIDGSFYVLAFLELTIVLTLFSKIVSGSDEFF